MLLGAVARGHEAVAASLQKMADNPQLAEGPRVVPAALLQIRGPPWGKLRSERPRRTMLNAGHSMAQDVIVLSCDT